MKKTILALVLLLLPVTARAGWVLEGTNIQQNRTVSPRADMWAEWTGTKWFVWQSNVCNSDGGEFGQTLGTNDGKRRRIALVSGDLNNCTNEWRTWRVERFECDTPASTETYYECRWNATLGQNECKQFDWVQSACGWMESLQDMSLCQANGTFCDAATCFNDFTDEGEDGEDCGGVCTAPCVASCPDGYTLADFNPDPMKARCMKNVAPDNYGNCPDLVNWYYTPEAIYDNGEYFPAVCTKVITPKFADTPIQISDVVYAGNNQTKTENMTTTSTDNGDGTTTKVTTWDVTNPDGSTETITTTELIDNTTGQTLQKGSTSTKTYNGNGSDGSIQDLAARIGQLGGINKQIYQAALDGNMKGDVTNAELTAIKGVLDGQTGNLTDIEAAINNNTNSVSGLYNTIGAGNGKLDNIYNAIGGGNGRLDNIYNSLLASKSALDMLYNAAGNGNGKLSGIYNALGSVDGSIRSVYNSTNSLYNSVQGQTSILIQKFNQQYNSLSGISSGISSLFNSVSGLTDQLDVEGVSGSIGTEIGEAQDGSAQAWQDAVQGDLDIAVQEGLNNSGSFPVPQTITSTIEQIVPSSTACVDYVIQVPTTEYTLTISCTMFERVRTMLSFVFSITTLLTLAGLVLDPPKTK